MTMVPPVFDVKAQGRRRDRDVVAGDFLPSAQAPAVAASAAAAEYKLRRPGVG